MIRIVTDSSADLPPEVCDRLGITVVPLTVRFGDREYVDGVDLDGERFWELLDESPLLPETAAPSAGAFLEAYERLERSGAGGVLAICLSSALSAAYQSAVIAAEQINDRFPVRVLDSTVVSMALGLQVIAAAEQAGQGADMDALTASSQERAGKTDVLAALDTMRYLRRGGRVGALQAAAAGVLDVKPLLRFEDGVIVPAGRVRTRAAALAALVTRAAEIAPRLADVAVIHADAGDVQRLVADLTDLLPEQRLLVTGIGPVVGTHAGPGAIGIAYRLR